MPPDNGTCPAHEAFKDQVLAALVSVKEIVQTEMMGLRRDIDTRFESLRDDINRRFEESATDRKNLHDKTNLLSIEVTRAMTRLNGATLHAHHRQGDPPDAPPFPQQRKEDTFSGWAQVYWKHILLVSILSALAGEHILPLITEILTK